MAAAVAAVDSAAEAALEADAADELPFLPEGAADSITAATLLQTVPPAVTALQNGISDMATAIKELLLPDQATEQAAANAELGSPDLTEVSIIATASTAALNVQPDSAAAAAADASAAEIDASKVQLQGGSGLERQKSNTFARQKSRAERRPKLLLLSNSLLMPLPAASLQPTTAGASTADAVNNKQQTSGAHQHMATASIALAAVADKQQIADALKPDSIPVNADATTLQPGNSDSIATVASSPTGAFKRAKTVNKATFAVPDETASEASIGSMRHASVTFGGSDKQHSPTARQAHPVLVLHLACLAPCYAAYRLVLRNHVLVA